MKKVLSIAIMLMLLISCQQSKYGQAGENAVQYVYEQFPNIREDIKNVEVFYEDSVLLTEGLSYMIIELLNKNILTRSSVKYKYWVNPIVMFNGDRIEFIREYRYEK